MGDAGSDDDDPDFFKNVYGQSYSRPTSNAPPRAPEKKCESPEGSSSPEKVDPNELPRDFSARGAKLWEDQAKASERNWKRRREEELMCKLCGESGHFAQVLGTRQCSDVSFSRVCVRHSYPSLKLTKQCHVIVNYFHHPHQLLSPTGSLCTITHLHLIRLA